MDGWKQLMIPQQRPLQRLVCDKYKHSSDYLEH